MIKDGVVDKLRSFSLQEPVFEEGRLYHIKAHDHFTRHHSTDKQVFLEVIGIYVGENEHYYKFVSLLYSDEPTEEGLTTPEQRMIVKGTLAHVNPLNLLIEDEIKHDVLESEETIR